VNGGGSMTDTAGGSSDAELLWAGEGYSAFASASATKTNLTVSYIDANEVVKYSYTLTNPLYCIPDDSASSPTQNSSYIVPSNLDYTTFIVPITAIAFLFGGFIFVAAIILVAAIMPYCANVSMDKFEVSDEKILIQLEVPKRDLGKKPLPFSNARFQTYFKIDT
jgi:hypothetical protein